MPFMQSEIESFVRSAAYAIDWSRPAYGDPITPWFPVFVWLPRKMWTGEWRWLSIVERRLIQKHDHLPGPFCQWFQYRRMQ